ncbi:MAG TPA: GAF domain-containing protein, partial [Gaiellaceae bacterium]|nr:GAF domain-containing protein [Gaiellaceae bacterium]
MSERTRPTVLTRWKERSRRQESETAPTDALRDGDGDSAARLTAALVQAGSPREAVAAVFDEVERITGADAIFLALVDAERAWATGFAARGVDEDWWRGVSVDLEHEPTGIAAAARERAPFAVYDIESAPNVSRRIAATVGAKSAAFVPFIADGRVVAVLVAATTR